MGQSNSNSTGGPREVHQFHFGAPRGVPKRKGSLRGGSVTLAGLERRSTAEYGGYAEGRRRGGRLRLQETEEP